MAPLPLPWLTLNRIGIGVSAAVVCTAIMLYVAWQAHKRCHAPTIPPPAYLAARIVPMRPRTAAKGPPLARGDPMGPTGEGCRRVSAPITVARCRRAWQPHQVASHLGT